MKPHIFVKLFCCAFSGSGRLSVSFNNLFALPSKFSLQSYEEGAGVIFPLF